MSVIIGRALPDARDGLKPVHRRVLYGMHEGGHTAEKKFSKSARSVGEVMGKYHPHGDQSIYDTMVRMAQEFSLRYPLVDGQGNFGSIDGDPPAAMRYTESRLDRISKHMLEDIEKKTVDFQPNFDDSEMEPTVLPARLPNLLLNGSDGIAVGMATRIPPHNLTEVAGAIELHVQRILEEGEENAGKPHVSLDEYMEHIKGPDLPTGAEIHGIDGIIDMYATGKGRFHVRSRCDVVDDSSGKRIVVHEIPYQVKKSDMLVHIADLVSKGSVIGIRDIRDESSKEGIRVVIEVKNNADPHAVLNQLYKSSRLQESYSANMMGILDGRPVLLTLSTMLHTYVEHRESVIERRAKFELEKAEARAHILEGLVKAQDRIDDVIAVGKASSSREQFEAVLQGIETMSGIAFFDFTEPQAKAIAERRLYQLSRLDVEKVQNDYEELKLKIADLKDIIASRVRRLNILIEELNEMVERHGDERRSEINKMPLSMDREDLIEERAIAITLTDDNYIRHVPVETFRVQNRGGKGLKGVATKDEDFPKSILTCFSKDRLLIFTNRVSSKTSSEGEEMEYNEGRVYGLKAWEIPQGSRTSKGTHIRNVLEMKEDEKVVSILSLPRTLVDTIESLRKEASPLRKKLKMDDISSEENERLSELENLLNNDFLAFATKIGKIKKSKLELFTQIFRKGKVAINLAENDELVSIKHGTNGSDVVLISSMGRACRFDFDSLKDQGRSASGVKGINLSKGGTLVGMMIAHESERDNTWVLTITKQGMCKRTLIGDGEMYDKLDANGQKTRNSKYPHESPYEYIRYRNGYNITSRGMQGPRTMAFNDSDEIVRAHQITNLDDQILLLSKKGIVIRIQAEATASTKGRVAKGTRVMELRNPKDKTSFTDELLYSAHLPSELIKLDEFDAMDTDGDGVVSREEFESAQAAKSELSLEEE